MAFDPLTWALGAALTAGSKKFLRWLRTDDVTRAQVAAVSVWQEGLPDGIDVHPETLFSAWKGAEERGGARESLASEFRNSGHVPQVTLWLAALVEQWEDVRAQTSPEERSTFFNLDAETARNHLLALAERLHDACAVDPNRFAQTVLRQIRLQEESSLGPVTLGTGYSAAPAEVQPQADSAVGEINAAVDRIRGGQLGAAAAALIELRKSKWTHLDAVEKYRVLANLGIIAVRRGKLREGANLFLEAYDFHPRDEKARLLRAWAHELRQDVVTAHSLAAELREAFPSLSGATAIWIRTSPDDMPMLTLLRQIPEHVTEDGDVTCALAVRAIRLDGDRSTAEGRLRALLASHPNHGDALQLLGQLLVSEASIAVMSDRPETIVRERLLEASRCFEQTLQQLSPEDHHDRLAGIYLDSAHCHQLLEDDEGAAAHLDKAWGIAIEQEDLRLRRVQLSLGNRRAEELLPELEAISAHGAVPDHYALVHALALRRRGAEGDVDRAIDILTKCARRPDIDLQLREDAFDLAVKMRRDASQFEEAEIVLATLTGTAAVPACIPPLLHAEVCFARGETDKATTFAQRAFESLEPGTPLRWRARLARLELELGDHARAFAVLRALQPGKVMRPADFDLINAAEATGNLQFLADYCRRLRTSGIDSAWLVDRELGALMGSGEVTRAIDIATDYLDNHLDDRLIRLQRSRLALRIGRIDLVNIDEGHIVPVPQADPIVGFACVEVLRGGGAHERAQAYAYDLYRRHRNSPEAHHALLIAMCATHGEEVKDVARPTVEPDCAVLLEEDGTDSWLIIETGDSPSLEHDELPANHEMAARLLGKRIGDTVEIGSRQRLIPRSARVKEVVHKHVFRYRDVLENWERRFPDLDIVQMFRAPRNADELKALLGPSLIQQAKRIDELEHLYSTNPNVSLKTFCAGLDATTLGGLGHLASRALCPVKCAYVAADEFAPFERNAADAHELIVAPSALATSILLDLDLLTLGSRLAIAQSTLDEIVKHVTELESQARAEGFLTAQGDDVVLIQRDKEGLLARARALEARISALQSSLEVFVQEARDICSEEEWQMMVQAVGIGEAESIARAIKSGAVLWTDDAPSGQLAHQMGAKRVWTQLVLAAARTRDQISGDALAIASARLMGMGYRPTRPDIASFLAAARLAQWTPDGWPLIQHLDLFGNHANPENLPKMAAVLLKHIWRSAPADRYAESITLRILDRIAAREGSMRNVAELLRLIDPIFALDALGARRAKICLRGWLAARGLTA